MPTIVKSLDVSVPVRSAFATWTDFESFPEFMEGVDEVKCIDGQHMHWKASMYGKAEEWEAEVTDMVPDHRIAWRSVSGAENTGLVMFEPVNEQTTRIIVKMGYEPSSMVERTEALLGLVDRRVEADLQRFKEFAEGRALEIGTSGGSALTGPT